MNGFLLIDKGAGWTSHDIIAKLRGILSIKKIGHAGTLDPFATGLLIVAINGATKLIDYVSIKDKEYVGTIDFSSSTTTYDTEGESTSNSDKSSIDIDIARQMITKSFLGDVKLIPPMYSAIKVNGKKLYELARKDKTIKLEPRSSKISHFELFKNKDPWKIDFSIIVSSGTYIRSIAHELGIALKRPAYLSRLERTKYFPKEEILNISNAKLISETSINDLIPINDVVDIKNMVLSDEQIKTLLDGKELSLPSKSKTLIVIDSLNNPRLLIEKVNLNYFKILKNLG